MKDNYLNACSVYLIEKLDFVPLRATHGGFSIYPEFRLFEKLDIASYTTLLLMDGDRLTASDVQYYLDITLKWLDSTGRHEAQLVPVVVFNSAVPLEKLKVLEDSGFLGQRNNILAASLIVELDKRAVTELPGMQAKTGKIQSLLDEILHLDISGFDELPDLEAVMNREQPLPRIEEASKKAPATVALIAINVAVWLLGQFLSVRYGIDYTLAYGIKHVSSILDGEFWRFVTPMFLHADLTHLGANSFSLLIFGQVVERIFGTRKFLALYFAGGLLGNFVSFAFSDVPSLGASGAVLGVGGALVYLWRRKPGAFSGRSRQYLPLVFMAFYNIFYGFVMPNIDNYAHIGGFLGGFFAAGVAGFKGNDAGLRHRLFLGAAFLAAVGFCVIWRFFR